MALNASIHRKEAWDKVCGRAKYADDLPAADHLCARLLTSTRAHARILGIDTAGASALPGVKAVLTGEDCDLLFGPLLQDRYALARGVARYAGEPVAMVVAVDEPAAEAAARRIAIEYEDLPPLLTPSQAMLPNAAPIHEKLADYKRVVSDVRPEPGTNVAARHRVRKGDAKAAFARCAAVIEKRFFLPPSDHLAMEVRAARAEIAADGNVLVTTCSQAPYTVKKQLAEAFKIEAGMITVRVPFVGGGFGGKAPVTLEILAYLASKSVGGRPVRLTIPREQDMASFPCRMGLEATVRLGADENGMLQAAEMEFLVDCGAYTDISPNMAKAIAADCTGPYRVENLSCDALCVYTNHTYATSFRSFSHDSYTFCVERALDALANRLGVDPLELRLKNAVRPGDFTPTGVSATPELTGDVSRCIEEVKRLSCWDGGRPLSLGGSKVRAKGVSCFWKSANPPTNAVSGAFVTFNSDGSVNLLTGVVEMGSGGHTQLAQILAEKLKLDPAQVHVVAHVDTRVAPEHWKTVASLTGYMAGNAVLRAADDLIAQLKRTGAEALGCAEAEIEVADGRVYSIKEPERFMLLKAVAQGYQTPGGASVGEPALGRGGYMLKGLSMLDPATGKGRTSPQWTPGAQVVEVEADLEACTYRVITACCVLDVGKVVNPAATRAMIAGGMSMGVSLATREAYEYDENGSPRAPNLRTYKLLHIGQEPEYRVDFVETPDPTAPCGARPYTEHGIIGIPAALANALSAAFGCALDGLPLRPEAIRRAIGGAP